MSAIERFLPLIQDAEDGESIPTPVVSTDDGVNFLYIRHNNLYCKWPLSALLSTKDVSKLIQI